MAGNAPRRPLLPNVLAALTKTPAGVWKLLASQVELTDRGVSVRANVHGETAVLVPRDVAQDHRAVKVLSVLGKGCVNYNRYGTAFITLTKECRRWTTRNAAEAWEILSSRGIIPIDAVDDPRRRFECSECEGWGRIHSAVVDIRNDAMSPLTLRACDACLGAGIMARPSSLPDVVSIASAWPSVPTAEALAQETHRAHGGGYAFERVAWSFRSSVGVPCLTPAARIQSLGFVASAVIGGTVTMVCPPP